MNNLFVPGQVKDEKYNELLDPSIGKEPEEEYVMVATVENKIYALPVVDKILRNDKFREDKKKFVLIKEREKKVRALCEWEGRLYDAGEDEKVYETLTDRVVTERPGIITSLAVNNGILFDAGNYPNIMETLNGNRYYGHRNMTVSAMCSHNNLLTFMKITKHYSAISSIHPTTRLEQLTALETYMQDICSFNGRLYYSYGEPGGPFGVASVGSNKHQKKDSPIYTFCEHKGELYDLEDWCLNQVLIDKCVYVFGTDLIPEGKHVTKLASIRKSLLEGYLDE